MSALDINPPSKRPVERVGNRRRQGYELTPQRDMMPVVCGAATAAVMVHVLLYFFFPETLRVGISDYLIPKVVDDETEVRVVVRNTTDEELEKHEAEVSEEPQEIETVAHEPEEIDILDVQIEELELAPGDTNIPMPSPVVSEEEAEPVPPAQLDLQAIQAEALNTDDISVPDPAPVNMNDVVAKASTEADDMAGLMNADLRNNAKESAKLPSDTRSLGELLGDNNLGASSGVARLGADLLFGFDDCKLRSSARISMLQLAALIRKNPDTRFLIEGHTDSIGAADYNALLGLQRAAAVRDWLEGNGIPTANVYIRSCGNNVPLAEKSGDRDKEALNRRVEIHMRKGGEVIPAGFIGNDYKVDTAKSVSALIAARTQIPQPAEQPVPLPKKPEPKPAPADSPAAAQEDIPDPGAVEAPRLEQEDAKPKANNSNKKRNVKRH